MMHTAVLRADEHREIRFVCSCGWSTGLGPSMDMIMFEVTMARHFIDVVGPRQFPGLMRAFDDRPAAQEPP